MGSVTKHNIVSQCKRRMNSLQLTIETRDTLAKSQCKYNLCLLAVAKSLRLIASRHSSPSSLDLTSYPFLYFDTPETTNNHSINTTSLKQTRRESNLEASSSPSSSSSSSSSSRPGKPRRPLSPSGKNKSKQASSSASSQLSKPTRPSSSSRKDKGKQTFFSTQLSKPACRSSSHKKGKGKEKLHPKNGLTFENIHEEAGEGEKHDDELAKTQPKPMPEPPLERDDVPEWDFFRPYDGLKAEKENDEDRLRRARKEEGAPELEKVEESERKEANNNVSEGETNNCKTETDGKVEGNGNDGEIKNENSLMTVNEGGTNQKDLLKALKQIEEHFLRAFESGLDVSKLLEVKKIHLKQGWERVIGAAGGSGNFFSFPRRGHSILSCTSCLSIFSSSRTRTSASWDEFRREPFHDYYVLLQSGSHAFTLSKLYAWEKILYQDVSVGEKCRKLFDRKCSRLRKEEAVEGLFSSKTSSKVRELHASIYVSVKGATSTSDKIIKVKDEELRPQIVELLQGLMKNSKVMCELHEAQSKILYEVGSFNCPTYGGFSNESQRHATRLLEERVESWRACFAEYISAQKSYLEALSKWISKCIDFRRGNEGSTDPPLLVMIKDWKINLDKLPSNEVINCMKSLSNDIRKVYVQQGKDQHQMRKVVKMTTRFDKKVAALKKFEDKVLGSESSTKEAVQFKFDDGYERLTAKRNSLATYQNKLDKNKAKHISGVQKTQTLTLERMLRGFSSVFESLVNFSRASTQMYADLVAYNENANGNDGNISNQT